MSMDIRLSGISGTVPQSTRLSALEILESQTHLVAPLLLPKNQIREVGVLLA